MPLITYFRKTIITMLSRVSSLGLLFLVFPIFVQAEAVKVVRITPSGTQVASGQQIVIAFDRPMVALGESAETETGKFPITFSPRLTCQWHWLSTSRLACQLDGENRLKAATKYQLKITKNKNISHRQEIGKYLAETKSHQFSTILPRARYIGVQTWQGPGKPTFYVDFNQEVSRQSVASSMTFKLQNGQFQNLVVSDPSPDAEQAQRTAKTFSSRWLVTPITSLSLDSSVKLQIKPGLKTEGGSLLGREKRDLYRFQTYPEFQFYGIRCRLEGSTKVTDLSMQMLEAQKLKLTEGESAPTCLPLAGVSLLFTAPVLNSQIKKNTGFQPRLNEGLKDFDPWKNRSDWSRLYGRHRSGQLYGNRIPVNLKADQKYQIDIDSMTLKDEFDRNLSAESVPEFVFVTSHREPKLTMTHQLAVLEQGVESDVPMYVTNLDNIQIAYSGVTAAGGIKAAEKNLEMASLPDISHQVPLETRSLLNATSGAIYSSIQADPQPAHGTSKQRLFAQVTPFQVHAKVGHFNTKVWVTRLDNGKPVKGAKVSLLRGTYLDLADLHDTAYGDKSNRRGIAELPGLSEFDPHLNYQYGGYDKSREIFFVKVIHKGELALLPLNYDFMVWGNIYASRGQKGKHSSAWGTTAQGVYKPGDSVQYKIYVRDQSLKHWLRPESRKYHLEVNDPTGALIYEVKDISLNEFGAIDGEFELNGDAVIGYYDFSLNSMPAMAESEEPLYFSPMSVLVSDFTTAPFKLATEFSGFHFSPGEQLKLNTIASLYAGGPYAAGELRLNVNLRQQNFVPPSTAVKLKGFSFAPLDEKQQSGNRSLFVQRGELNASGEAEKTFELQDQGIDYGVLEAEAAVRDERGKFVAATASAKYIGRDRFVGLKNTQWLYATGKSAAIELVVSNLDGELVAGSLIEVEVQRETVKAARVKSAGSAYLVRNTKHWVKQHECDVLSAGETVRCEFTPQLSGRYRILASIKDSKDRIQQSTISAWVTGSDYVQWDQGETSQLEIEAEKSSYKLGETARYLIKNPIPDATALITIERLGVIDSWTQKLKGSMPVLSFKIKKDYQPGFYLSVVLQSPRIQQPMSDGGVDLGKPAFQMAYVESQVEDDSKRLVLKVETDQLKYRPGESVIANISVLGKRALRREPIELAIAVVDESVLALNREGNAYYDPYQGFNFIGELDVSNFSLMSRLVGRQKFEKKGANPGGGGGGTSLRNNFSYVSYWNPSVKTNKKGRAEVKFNVPDNLTGWRVLVMAVSKDERMGLAHQSFKVNRPTEIRPVMPNQLRAGDNFSAGFSVMNRTEKTRTITTNIVYQIGESTKVETKQVILELAPFQRQKVFLDVKNVAAGTLHFMATAGDDFDTDRLAHHIDVQAYDFRTMRANSGSLIDGEHKELVVVPEGATDAELVTYLSLTAIGRLDGAIAYLENYAFSCYEQQLSKAIGSSMNFALADYLQPQSDAEKLKLMIKRPLKNAASYQAQNGGMAFWRADNNRVSPYLSLYTAMAYQWLAAQSYEIDEMVEARLHQYLLGLLKRTELPSGWQGDTRLTIQAGILSALSHSDLLNKQDVLRLAGKTSEMDLFTTSLYLNAVVNVLGEGAEIKQQLVSRILSFGNETTSDYRFNTTNVYRPHLLGGPDRAACTALSSLIAVDKNTDEINLEAKDLKLILPKIVRGILADRGDQLHWQNTQSNAYCLQALHEYAATYENNPGEVSIVLSLNDAEAIKTVLKMPAPASHEVLSTLVQPENTLLIKAEAGQPVHFDNQLSYQAAAGETKTVNAGFDIKREYSKQSADGRYVKLDEARQAGLHVGDLVRVDLFLQVPVDRYYVVVEDPLPGGFEPINGDLATSSALDLSEADLADSYLTRLLPKDSYYHKLDDWQTIVDYGDGFYHQSLGFKAARFFADRLRPGHYHLFYQAQVIAKGKFSSLPVKVEEMYRPSVYGHGKDSSIDVEAMLERP